jgi:hypothetical protein
LKKVPKLKKCEIEQIIHELLRKSGSEASVQLESRFPGGRLVGGKYCLGEHSITMYMDVIKQQCVQLFSSLAHMPDYLAVVFAHELGHAEDPELPVLAERLDTCLTERERKETALQIEENAWEFAKWLLPEIDRNFMEAIISHSLQPYHEQLAAETIQHSHFSR